VEVSRQTLAEVFGRNPRSPTMPQPFAFKHPEPDPVHIKGDELGRSYTPQHVASAIVGRLYKRGVFMNRVLEPCVGGGAFVDAVQATGCRPCHVTGVDVDPDARGFELCDDRLEMDFTSPAWHAWCYAKAGRTWDLAITNPPFGREVGQPLTLAIVTGMLMVADVAAVLVPLDYLTQKGWAVLISECVEVWPIVGRVWDHERGMVVLVWDRRIAHGTALHRPLECPK
jgi:hypothetical protein